MTSGGQCDQWWPVVTFYQLGLWIYSRVDDQPVNLLVRGTIQDVYDRRS